MKLGCASWGFREHDLPRYFAAAAELGLRYVEVECFNETEAPAHIPSGVTGEQMRRIRAEAERTSVRIVSFAAGNDFTVDDAAAVAADMARIKRMIDLACETGVEIIRLFAGWTAEENITEGTYRRVTEAFREAGSYAGENGVVLALENHGGITKTPEQVERILNKVDLPSVGLNYDPANFHHGRVDPSDALKLLEKFIVYAHLKDSVFGAGAHEFKALGEGSIDWSPIMDWLKTQYSGYAMIEYENPADVEAGTRRSVEFLKTAWND